LEVRGKYFKFDIRNLRFAVHDLKSQISDYKIEISNLKYEIEDIVFINVYPCSSVREYPAYRSPHFSLLRRISKYVFFAGRTRRNLSGALLI
jgi:hypothetical protein